MRTTVSSYTLRTTGVIFFLDESTLLPIKLNVEFIIRNWIIHLLEDHIWHKDLMIILPYSETRKESLQVAAPIKSLKKYVKNCLLFNEKNTSHFVQTVSSIILAENTTDVVVTDQEAKTPAENRSQRLWIYFHDTLLANNFANFTGIYENILAHCTDYQRGYPKLNRFFDAHLLLTEYLELCASCQLEFIRVEYFEILVFFAMKPKFPLCSTMLQKIRLDVQFSVHAHESKTFLLTYGQFFLQPYPQSGTELVERFLSPKNNVTLVKLVVCFSLASEIFPLLFLFNILPEDAVDRKRARMNSNNRKPSPAETKLCKGIIATMQRWEKIILKLI